MKVDEKRVCLRERQLTNTGPRCSGQNDVLQQWHSYKRYAVWLVDVMQWMSHCIVDAQAAACSATHRSVSVIAACWKPSLATKRCRNSVFIGCNRQQRRER